MKADRQHKSLWHKALTWLLIFICAVASTGLVASAYAGAINPVDHPFAPVIAMTFPLWLIGAVVAIAITLFLRKWVTLIVVAGICVAMPSILDYSPLHLPSKVSDDAETFTIMSYNVFGFVDQSNAYPGGVNPVISHILREDPDIACLQEATFISPSSSEHITASQIDSLHAQYPYVLIGSRSQAILSKFPVEPVNIGFKYANVGGAADMACFRAEIKGHKVTIFNIHLQSFDLVTEDREMFLKLTRLEGNESEIKQMQRHLIDKICAAGPRRVLDTRQLMRYIDKYGGPNVIVCGDFNDVPGCYSLRLLAGLKLKEVYPEVGFGPMITYNAGRFYFRIDHILYRGDMKPVAMKRGKIRSSDHYPIEATFEISNP